MKLRGLRIIAWQLFRITSRRRTVLGVMHAGFQENNCGAIIKRNAIQTSGYPLWAQLRIRIGEGIYGEREVEKSREKKEYLIGE